MSIGQWFRLVGYPVSPWLAWGIAVVFGAIARGEAKKARLTLACVFAFIGMVVMMMEVL